MSVGYAVSSIFCFIIRIVSFKRLLPPPSETIADYLQNNKQMYLFLWVLQNALSENFINLSL